MQEWPVSSDGVISLKNESNDDGSDRRWLKELKAVLNNDTTSNIIEALVEYLKNSGVFHAFKRASFEEKFKRGMHRWLESLFEVDDIHESYMDNRFRIGISYVRLKLGMTIIIRSYEFVRKSLMMLFSDYEYHYIVKFNEYLDKDLTFVLKAYESEQKRLTEQAISQLKKIRELSSPVIEIWERTLLVPIVGYLDSMRVKYLEDSLLNQITFIKAKVIIIDLTGCSLVDTETTKNLVEIKTLANILGSNVIFVGIRPIIAKSLVRLGIYDIDSFTVYTTLSKALYSIVSK